MKRGFVYISVALLMLVLSACGAQSEAPETVLISLTEFGIQSDSASFEAGQAYRFVIINNGALNHEFTIMPPGESGGMGMEGHDMGNMSGAFLHVAEDQLSPGAVVTIDYVFSQPASVGDLEFACHFAGHYEAGMLLPITVSG